MKYLLLIAIVISVTGAYLIHTGLSESTNMAYWLIDMLAFGICSAYLLSAVCLQNHINQMFTAISGLNFTVVSVLVAWCAIAYWWEDILAACHEIEYFFESSIDWIVGLGERV